MVNCDMCGKKIGILESKVDYINDKGKPIVYCSKCDLDAQKEEQKEKGKKRKIDKEKKDKADKIAKEKELKNILQKNHQWEYKILNLKTIGANEDKTLDPNNSERLNDLGLEGWELISSTAINSTKVGFGVDSTPTKIISCIFKRKL